MTRSWLPGALGTLIGSMPHRDPQRVIDLIVQAMGDIPVWPQLPAYASPYGRSFPPTRGNA